MAEYIADLEPHFPELVALFEKHRFKRQKADIFKLWMRMIKPDNPKINVQQFINWTRRYNQKEVDDLAMEMTPGDPETDIDLIEGQRAVTIVELEKNLRRATGMLVDEAVGIMEEHQENPMPLKERYFAMAVVSNVWKNMTKEKEIAIKMHAEKRESVGLFAKLLRGAMSGEFTMEDLEKMQTATVITPHESTAAPVS